MLKTRVTGGKRAATDANQEIALSSNRDDGDTDNDAAPLVSFEPPVSVAAAAARTEIARDGGDGVEAAGHRRDEKGDDGDNGAIYTLAAAAVSASVLPRSKRLNKNKSSDFV